MKPKHLYCTVLFLLLTSLASRADSMNVIFILADDLGWADTTLYGHTRLYQTPHIERLAERGMTFTRAYANSPLCSPTRASLLTGQTPTRHGSTAPTHHLKQVTLKAGVKAKGPPGNKALITTSVSRLDTTYPTLVKQLKAAGYRTAHFGKWHLGHPPYSPLEHGFDVDIPHYPGPGPAGSFVAPWRFPEFKANHPGEHIEDRMAEEAVKWLTAVKKDQPFYLNYWQFSVHAPFDAKPELIDSYRGKIDSEDAQRSPTYAAMVHSLDDAVGSLLDAIDHAGIAEETVIVFYSDNGGNMYNEVDGTTPTSNRPLRGGKATIYEGGIRVPCVVVWPGVTRPGSRSDERIQTSDFYPTLLNQLGASYPVQYALDGIDITPALRGGKLERQAIFTYFPHAPPVPDWLPPSISAHSGKWKLIRLFHQGENGAHDYRLYDLAQDQGEQDNLATRHPEIVAKLDELIESHLKDSRAVVPLPNPAFDPAQYRPEEIGIPADRHKNAKHKQIPQKGNRESKKTTDQQLKFDIASAHHLEVKVLEGGGYEVRTTGDDPFIACQPLSGPYHPHEQYILSFEYFCPRGLSDIELFYGPPFKAEQSAAGPELLSSEGWTRYALDIKASQEPESWRGGYTRLRIDFGRDAGRTIQLRNIQLRAPTPLEVKKAGAAGSASGNSAAFDEALQALLNREYDVAITGIAATTDTLQINIHARRAAEDLVLCEVPFYQSPVGRQTFSWQQKLDAGPGSRTIEVDRVRGKHDRVFSSWIVMKETARGLVPASTPRYVDTLPAKWSLERDRPKSKKGLTGLRSDSQLMIDDYKDLGIHNATKNILLPDLVTRAPGEDSFPHSFNGSTVHINRKSLQNLDQSMREMDRLNAVVSAIILIPKETPMSHPDCAPQGIYAMANVVEQAGWEAYAAGLDFLAQRYMRPDRKYGRITHWIMHNEVDAGWIWTNAGDKPLATYLDLYYRSMRTAQSVIRRYGSAGQVLMSLTHYWTTRHNRRCYPPRAMIDLLAKRSSLEGEFDWGLAYHPYPENLRDPRTWLDKKVTFDFGTPIISPKNLEVLDAYMHQPEMRYRGEVRTIVLSEQGSNSPGHTPEDYRDQAAGLVYTWLKFEQLPSIESYVLHRWMDHPKEGGLNLGLRTHGKTDQDAKKKTAWEIYRQLGTPEQSQAVAWAKTVIPAKAFQDIPARVKVP